MFDPEDAFADVVKSGLAVSFEPFATIPASGAGGEPARLQHVAAVTGTDLVAAVDTRGLLWAVSPDGSVTQMADLRGAVGFIDYANGAGLRAVAFHPGFADAQSAGYGKLYLAYSAEVAGAQSGAPTFASGGGAPLFHDVVAEFTVADPAAPVLDLASVRELMRIEQPLRDHNIGEIAFDDALSPGDPGYGQLWISTGDGGGPNNPLGTAGDPGFVHGKMLRIDPLGTGPGDYAVPTGNPFIGQAGALPEVVAVGFRNPQAFDFDQGRVLLGDIGQDAIEEVNLVRIGGHHGWGEREGILVNDGGVVTNLPPDDARNGYQYPISGYDHEEITQRFAAIAGGVAYRGDDVPALAGQYLFADFPGGRLFTLDLDRAADAMADGFVTSTEFVMPESLVLVNASGQSTSFSEVAGRARDGRVDLRIGETADGEILVFGKQNGVIYRLTADKPGEVFYGTDGDDTLYGGKGSDAVRGGAGDDVIYGDTVEDTPSAPPVLIEPEDWFV